MFMKAIGAFLLLIGLFFALFGVYFIALGYEAEGWSAVEGEVTSVVVEVDISTPTSTHGARLSSTQVRRYYPSITYTWQARGQSYTSSRYQLGETHEKFKEREDAVGAALKYRNGMPITVYYDSDDPSQAVLDPSLSIGVFVPLPLGLIFIALGWLLFKHGPALEALAAKNQAAAKASSTLP